MKLSTSSVHPFSPLSVKCKRTGELLIIKDYRFNPELHEKTGKEVVVDAPEEAAETESLPSEPKVDKDSINTDLKRDNLEQIASSLGMTQAEIEDCTNKVKLVAAIHDKL